MKKCNNVRLLCLLLLFVPAWYNCTPVDQDLRDQVNKLKEKIETDKQSKPITTYVVIDRTASKFGINVEREKTGFLNRVSPHFTKPPDEIVICYGYHNTVSPTNFHRYRLLTPYPNLEGIDNADETQLILLEYLAKLNEEKKEIFTLIEKEHFEVPSKAPRSQLLASLYLVAKDMRRQGANRVYHFLAFSDGIESSEIRKFQADSLKEAKQNAAQDAKVLSDAYELQPDDFQHLAGITFQLPADTLMNTNPVMNFVPQYWEGIFSELGCEAVPYFTGDIKGEQ